MENKVLDEDDVSKAKARAQKKQQQLHLELLQKQLELHHLDNSPSTKSSLPPDSPFNPPFLPRSSSSSSSSTTASNSRARQGSKALSSVLRSLVRGVSLPCLAPFPGAPSSTLSPVSAISSRKKRSGARVTGTLFGYRKGHVHFSVQEDPRSSPMVLLELTTPTSVLVREMASGLVRIALECERRSTAASGGAADGTKPLLNELEWTMYCNGRRSGYALRRHPGVSEMEILRKVQAVSMGAGVLPMEQQDPDGELMYMRARFERVVGSKDSEAFYMMNPDRTGGPELSIFLLRI